MLLFVSNVRLRNDSVTGGESEESFCCRHLVAARVESAPSPQEQVFLACLACFCFQHFFELLNFFDLNF